MPTYGCAAKTARGGGGSPISWKPAAAMSATQLPRASTQPSLSFARAVVPYSAPRSWRP